MMVLLASGLLLIGAPAVFLLLGRIFERLTQAPSAQNVRPAGERWYHRKTHPARPAPDRTERF